MSWRRHQHNVIIINSASNKQLTDQYGGSVHFVLEVQVTHPHILQVDKVRESRLGDVGAEWRLHCRGRIHYISYPEDRNMKTKKGGGLRFGFSQFFNEEKETKWWKTSPGPDPARAVAASAHGHRKTRLLRSTPSATSVRRRSKSERKANSNRVVVKSTSQSTFIHDCFRLTNI